MGFLKKKYQTPDFENVGYNIARNSRGQSREKRQLERFNEEHFRENLKIIDRHRSKENIKKKMRKERSLGRKDTQNTPHKLKKKKYKKKKRQTSQIEKSNLTSEMRYNYVI